MSSYRKQELELVKEVQKGNAIVEIKTGNVYERICDEFWGTREYLGRLRRKAIPNRRKLERELKEEEDKLKKKELQKSELENLLDNGLTTTMTLSNYNPEISERFNLHMGSPYRIIISGTNPTDTQTYDGIMSKLTAFVDKKGFTMLELTLENGITFDSYSPEERELFDKEVFIRGNYRLIGFGSIIDKKGFYKVRDRLSEEKK
jgi:hypothetical protein|tara:strand:- start:220 stop:831 length:612 start_codon:yes stop_codon:yes gene_type:complete